MSKLKSTIKSSHVCLTKTGWPLGREVLVLDCGMVQQVLALAGTEPSHNLQYKYRCQRSSVPGSSSLAKDLLLLVLCSYWKYKSRRPGFSLYPPQTRQITNPKVLALWVVCDASHHLTYFWSAHCQDFPHSALKGEILQRAAPYHYVLLFTRTFRICLPPKKRRGQRGPVTSLDLAQDTWDKKKICILIFFSRLQGDVVHQSWAVT